LKEYLNEFSFGIGSSMFEIKWIGADSWLEFL